MPAIRGPKSKKKTRRYVRDVDQIHADIHSPGHLERFKDTKLPEDLPGLGEFYCTECAKWFESDANYVSHKKGSQHRRRVKQLKEEPHTQKEAEEATGLRTDNGKRAIQTATATTAMDIAT